MNLTKTKKTTKLFTIIFAASLLAGACSNNQSTDSDDTSGQTETPTDDSTTESKTSEKVTLTLLAYDSFTPSPNIFDDFTAQTGINVEISLGGDAGELVTKAGLTSGHPRSRCFMGRRQHTSFAGDIKKYFHAIRDKKSRRPRRVSTQTRAEQRSNASRYW